MALHRGIQSALFYYLSCTPCSVSAYRRQRRKEATRDTAEREAASRDYEQARPAYHHYPSPFATNPNWSTEIELGPSHGPARKRRREKGLLNNQWGLQIEETTTTTSDITMTSSGNTSDGPKTSGGSARNDSRLGVRHRQRPDEELWGSSAKSDREKHAAERGQTRLHLELASTPHPPINDLHPAIVTKLSSKQDALWMLQPPPPARVMLGKEDPARKQTSARHSSADRADRLTRPSATYLRRADELSNSTSLDLDRGDGLRNGRIDSVGSVVSITHPNMVGIVKERNAPAPSTKLKPRLKMSDEPARPRVFLPRDVGRPNLFVDRFAPQQELLPPIDLRTVDAVSRARVSASKSAVTASPTGGTGLWPETPQRHTNRDVEPGSERAVIRYRWSMEL